MPKKTETNWKNIWAGSWGVLDVSDWVEFYTSKLKTGRRSFLNTVTFVVHNGKSSCWVDADYLSGTHAALSHEYPTLASAKTLAATLKKKVDAVMAAMQAPIVDPAASYEAYRKTIRDYYIPHVHVKYLVEGLSPQKLEKFLPVLQVARVYAEPVFEETLHFASRLGAALRPQTKLSPALLQYLTRDELKAFFKNGKLPKTEVLKQRQRFCVGLLSKGKPLSIYYGDKAKQLEKKLTVVPKELRGQTAYVGVVEGVVRIVTDPKKPGTFNTGDILVTGMTRPDFIPLMEKAGALVTDAGGMLSHAAITARELRKPCVVGTQVATKVLKSGQRVRVDAGAGTVVVIK